MTLILSRYACKDVFNVAPSDDVSLTELVKQLAAVAGQPDPTVLIGYQDFDLPPHAYFPFGDYPLRLDSTKIRTLLGWEPKIDLRAGLLETFATLDLAVLCERPIDRELEDEILRRHKGGVALAEPMI